MSRIGKLPIKIPTTVDVTNNSSLLEVKGKFGTLERITPEMINVEQKDGTLIVSVKKEGRANKALHGLYRTLINNMVVGVEEGFTKTLEVNGVGYRAAIESDVLQLQLGYSHDIKVGIPKELTVKCTKPTEIVITGADKQKVGQFAAEIRALRKPEPYKGKGVRYLGEYVRKKKVRKNR